jgi:hypothetical protein
MTETAFCNNRVRLLLGDPAGTGAVLSPDVLLAHLNSALHFLRGHNPEAFLDAAGHVAAFTDLTTGQEIPAVVNLSIYGQPLADVTAAYAKGMDGRDSTDSAGAAFLWQRAMSVLSPGRR